MFVGEGPGSTSRVDRGELGSGAGKGGDERRDRVGVLVGEMVAFVLVVFRVGEVDGV